MNINDPAWGELYPDMALSERVGPDGSEMFMHSRGRASLGLTEADVIKWMEVNAPQGVMTEEAEARTTKGNDMLTIEKLRNARGLLMMHPEMTAETAVRLAGRYNTLEALDAMARNIQGKHLFVSTADDDPDMTHERRLGWIDRTIEWLDHAK